MSNKKIISLQLDEDLLQKLQQEANSNFRSISAEIRLILTEYFNNKHHM